MPEPSKRLCLIAHAPYPTGDVRLQRAATAARSAGYDVQVLALRQPGQVSHEIVDGIQVQRLPVSRLRGAPLYRVLLGYLRFVVLAAVRVLALSRKERFAVIQVHAPPEALIVAALVPRIRSGTRVILDIRDISWHLWDARFPDGRASTLVRWLLRTVERFASIVAGRVVTVHEPYRKALIQDGVSSSKLTVVMNSPDEDLIARASRGVSRAPRGEEFVVIYHGTITSWYGVDLLVRAAALAVPSLPQLRVEVIGEGDALPRVQRLAAELGVAERIAFSAKALSLNETLARVAQADCGVIPNPASTLNHYLLPNKLLEYVALNVPVVSARLTTITEYFSGDELTFFTPSAIAELAGAIQWVAENPKAVAEKASRARRRAEAYRWRDQRARYLRVLREVAFDDVPSQPLAGRSLAL